MMPTDTMADDLSQGIYVGWRGVWVGVTKKEKELQGVFTPYNSISVIVLF